MFAGVIKEKNIHHFSTSSNTKASIMECFKERLYCHFMVKNTLGYLPVIWSKDTMHPTIALSAWHLIM